MTLTLPTPKTLSFAPGTTLDDLRSDLIRADIPESKVAKLLDTAPVKAGVLSDKFSVDRSVAQSRSLASAETPKVILKEPGETETPEKSILQEMEERLAEELLSVAEGDIKLNIKTRFDLGPVSGKIVSRLKMEVEHKSSDKEQQAFLKKNPTGAILKTTYSLDAEATGFLSALGLSASELRGEITCEMEIPYKLDPKDGTGDKMLDTASKRLKGLLVGAWTSAEDLKSLPTGSIVRMRFSVAGNMDGSASIVSGGLKESRNYVATWKQLDGSKMQIVVDEQESRTVAAGVDVGSLVDDRLSLGVDTARLKSERQVRPYLIDLNDKAQAEAALPSWISTLSVPRLMPDIKTLDELGTRQKGTFSYTHSAMPKVSARIVSPAGVGLLLSVDRTLSEARKLQIVLPDGAGKLSEPEADEIATSLGTLDPMQLQQDVPGGTRIQLTTRGSLSKGVRVGLERGLGLDGWISFGIKGETSVAKSETTIVGLEINYGKDGKTVESARLWEEDIDTVAHGVSMRLGLTLNLDELGGVDFIKEYLGDSKGALGKVENAVAKQIKKKLEKAVDKYFAVRYSERSTESDAAKHSLLLGPFDYQKSAADSFAFAKLVSDLDASAALRQGLLVREDKVQTESHGNKTSFWSPGISMLMNNEFSSGRQDIKLVTDQGVRLLRVDEGVFTKTKSGSFLGYKEKYSVSARGFTVSEKDSAGDYQVQDSLLHLRYDIKDNRTSESEAAYWNLVDILGLQKSKETEQGASTFFGGLGSGKGVLDAGINREGLKRLTEVTSKEARQIFIMIADRIAGSSTPMPSEAQHDFPVDSYAMALADDYESYWNESAREKASVSFSNRYKDSGYSLQDIVDASAMVGRYPYAWKEGKEELVQEYADRFGRDLLSDSAQIEAGQLLAEGRDWLSGATSTEEEKEVVQRYEELTGRSFTNDQKILVAAEKFSETLLLAKEEYEKAGDDPALQDSALISTLIGYIQDVEPASFMVINEEQEELFFVSTTALLLLAGDKGAVVKKASYKSSRFSVDAASAGVISRELPTRGTVLRDALLSPRP